MHAHNSDAAGSVLDKTTARNDRKLLDMIRADRELHGLPHIDDVEWYNGTEEARLVRSYIAPSLEDPHLMQFNPP